MRRIALALSILAASAASAAALTPAQLTPAEKTMYAKVKTNPTAAKNFLATREYVRQAQAAVKNPASAASFPDQPEGFDVAYLLAGDSDTIDQAVTLSVASMAKTLWA